MLLPLCCLHVEHFWTQKGSALGVLVVRIRRLLARRNSQIVSRSGQILVLGFTICRTVRLRFIVEHTLCCIIATAFGVIIHLCSNLFGDIGRLLLQCFNFITSFFKLVYR